MKNTPGGAPAKRNIVTPYNALLTDIRDFIAKLKKSNEPKTATRGTLPIANMEWLGECVRTAETLGYKVEVRVVKGKDELEFVLIEKTTQPQPAWRWTR